MKTLDQLRAERKLQQPAVTPTPTINLAQPSSTTPQMTEVGKQKVSAAISKTTRPLQQGLGAISDVLNLGEYALAGFQKGAWGKGQQIKQEKGLTRKVSTPGEAAQRIWAGIKNVPSGIKERTNLQDVNIPEKVGIQNKAAQAAINLAGSLTIPAVPIGKIAKATKLETTVPKLLGKAVEAGEKVPGVNKAIEFGKKFIRTESAPKKFLSKYDEYQRNLSKAAEETQNVIRPLLYDEKGKKLPEQTQRVIQEILGLSEKTSKAVTPEELSYIKKYGQVADSTLAKFRKLAEEDIRAGADPKIYERFLGKYYGKRTYQKVIEKQAGKEVPSFIKSKQPRLDLSLYKERKDLPEEIQKELGKIQTPAYGAALSYYGTKKNIATRDFYKWIAKNYVDKGEDLVALPKSEKLGILSGRKVPRKIYDNLNEIVNPTKYNETYAKAIQFFKKGKTILSPKQLIRNIPASLMQMYMNPSGRADAIRRVPEAMAEMKNKGRYYKEFKSVGGVGQTQIGEVFSQAIPRELEKYKGKTTYDKVVKAIETPGAAMQEYTEDIAKLSVFINERKDGKSVMEALKAAEETGFNYQKVSPFVQKLRSGKTGIGMSVPFITYPMKAAELTAKTLYKQPQRLKNVGSVERAIQGLSEPGNEQYLPDYLQQAVRTPFKSPKTKNQIYANLKYLYPYGNLLEGGTPLGLTPDPLLSEAVTQLLTKRDVYLMMQKLQDGGDPMDVKQLSDSEIMGMPWTAPVRHLLETVGPTPVRSLFKWVDSQTKQKVSATSPSGLETVLQEMGAPIYQYSPATGATVQNYQRTQKIKEAKSALDKYMKEAKPGTVGYQMGLEAKRKAWLDAMTGK